MFIIDPRRRTINEHISCVRTSKSKINYIYKYKLYY